MGVLREVDQGPKASPNPRYSSGPRLRVIPQWIPFLIEKELRHLVIIEVFSFATLYKDLEKSSLEVLVGRQKRSKQAKLRLAN